MDIIGYLKLWVIILNKIIIVMVYDMALRQQV